MRVFCEQLVFLARKDGFEDWMQILVFVAMIAVYSLSGILKAKMKKKEPEGGKQRPQRPRPAGPVPRPQYRQGAQPQRKKVVRPQPAVQKMAVKAEKSGRIPTTKLYIEPKGPIPISQAQQGILEAPKYDVKMQKLPKFTGKTISEPEVKHVSPVVPTEAAKTITYFADDLLDVSDPEALRRAILHYEILGKPLSLRGPRDIIF